jgi:hypothetical protein
MYKVLIPNLHAGGTYHYGNSNYYLRNNYSPLLTKSTNCGLFIHLSAIPDVWFTGYAYDGINSLFPYTTKELLVYLYDKIESK